MKIQVGERYKLQKKKKIQPLLHTNNLRLDIYPFKFSQFHQVFILNTPATHPYIEIFHIKAGFTILNAQLCSSNKVVNKVPL